MEYSLALLLVLLPSVAFASPAEDARRCAEGDTSRCALLGRSRAAQWAEAVAASLRDEAHPDPALMYQMANAWFSAACAGGDEVACLSLGFREPPGFYVTMDSTIAVPGVAAAAFGEGARLEIPRLDGRQIAWSTPKGDFTRTLLEVGAFGPAAWVHGRILATVVPDHPFQPGEPLSLLRFGPEGASWQALPPPAGKAWDKLVEMDGEGRLLALVRSPGDRADLAIAPLGGGSPVVLDGARLRRWLTLSEAGGQSVTDLEEEALREASQPGARLITSDDDLRNVATAPGRELSALVMVDNRFNLTRFLFSPGSDPHIDRFDLAELMVPVLSAPPPGLDIAADGTVVASLQGALFLWEPTEPSPRRISEYLPQAQGSVAIGPGPVAWLEDVAYNTEGTPLGRGEAPSFEARSWQGFTPGPWLSDLVVPPLPPVPPGMVASPGASVRVTVDGARVKANLVARRDDGLTATGRTTPGSPWTTGSLASGGWTFTAELPGGMAVEHMDLLPSSLKDLVFDLHASEVCTVAITLDGAPAPVGTRLEVHARPQIDTVVFDTRVRRDGTVAFYGFPPRAIATDTGDLAARDDASCPQAMNLWHGGRIRAMRDGSPLEGVRVDLANGWSFGDSFITGADGWAELPALSPATNAVRIGGADLTALKGQSLPSDDVDALRSALHKGLEVQVSRGPPRTSTAPEIKGVFAHGFDTEVVEGGTIRELHNGEFQAPGASFQFSGERLWCGRYEGAAIRWTEVPSERVQLVDESGWPLPVRPAFLQLETETGGCGARGTFSQMSGLDGSVLVPSDGALTRTHYLPTRTAHGGRRTLVQEAAYEPVCGTDPATNSSDPFQPFVDGGPCSPVPRPAR